MWQLCGSDPERRFTWDMANNDNHVFGGGFQPRARYDRYVFIYLFVLQLDCYFYLSFVNCDKILLMPFCHFRDYSLLCGTLLCRSTHRLYTRRLP